MQGQVLEASPKAGTAPADGICEEGAVGGQFGIAVQSGGSGCSQGRSGLSYRVGCLCFRALCARAGIVIS